MVEVFDRVVVFERDDWTCKRCGIAVGLDVDALDPTSATVDHVIPLSQGGDHILANVQSLCLMCNSIKGARLDVTQSHEGVGGDPQEPQVKRPLGRWLAVQTPELSIGGDRQ